MSRETFKVYALIDPRTNAAFYIGMSINPRQRFSTHRSDWWSAANPRIRCIRRNGLEPKMGILAEFPTFGQAAEYEALAILKVPNLDNCLPNGKAIRVCVCSFRGVSQCDGKQAAAEYLRYFNRSESLRMAKLKASELPPTQRGDDEPIH